MTRRADPVRIATAHRAGLRGRLVSFDRIPESQVDAWLNAAYAEGLDRELAHDWILLQVGLGRKPPSPPDQPAGRDR